MKVRASRPQGTPSAQSRFHAGVFRRDPAVCVMCTEFPVDAATRDARPQDFEWLQAAHVIPKRDLYGADKEAPENGLVLCVYHHARNDHWVERVPRALLPAGAVAFASRADLAWLLDREYPA